jgi:hypothetical protein
MNPPILNLKSLLLFVLFAFYFSLEVLPSTALALRPDLFFSCRNLAGRGFHAGAGSQLFFHPILESFWAGFRPISLLKI